jgi:uroporphyrinogen-III synthase
VRPLTPAIDLHGVAALAFTSANGVLAFAALCPDRARPVFAVGAATARAARDAGFTAVASAEGDVQALARLIGARPPAGAVLAALAREPAGDLAADLAARGLPARTIAVYETVPTDAAAPRGAQAVLVHSPRAAELLALRLADGAGAGLLAACISPAAAAPLAATALARLAVADRPDEDALLALLR